MKSKIFNQEQMEYIKKICAGRYKKETLKLLNDQFKTEFTFNQLDGFMGRNKLDTGLTGHFKKGQTSWNKGKKMKTVGRTSETQFKKGQTPINWRPLGSERINVDGYLEIKTEEPSTWELKHRLVYKEHYGEIPKNHAVIFNNGNRTDCSIENLLLVSRSQLAILNRRGLLKDSKELNESALMVADLILKLGEIKKKR